MPLYQYPLSAKVDRFIAKNKFYQQGHANKKIEQLFIDQVDDIRWMYKLSKTTIHLEEQPDLKEIQIFQINSRVKEFDIRILEFIDKAILMPIIFEIHYENQIRVITTYKRLNQVDKSKVVLGQYYTSEWMQDSPRIALPVILNIVDLYEHFIKQVLPIPQVDGPFEEDQRTIEQKIEETEQLESLQKQITQLKAKIQREKQFNRKVSLNQQLSILENRMNERWL